MDPDFETASSRHNVARFFVENRHVSWVLFAAVLAWGIWAYQVMPKRKDPNIPVRQVAVITPWQGQTGFPDGSSRGRGTASILQGFRRNVGVDADRSKPSRERATTPIAHDRDRKSDGAAFSVPTFFIHGYRSLQRQRDRSFLSSRSGGPAK